MSISFKDQIKNPNELIEGDPQDGSWGQIVRNMGGIVEYVKIITTGDSKAVKNGVLGNSYFKETGLKCNDIKSNKRVPLFIYKNNKMIDDNGKKVSIINGLQKELGNLSPDGLLDGFGKSNDISCVEVDLETVSMNGGNMMLEREKHHVDIKSLKKMNGCLFGRRDKMKNSDEIWNTYLRKGSKCEEGFRLFSESLNQNDKESSKDNISNMVIDLKNKPLANLYNLGIGALLIILAAHLMKKIKL